jgi:hypothetical protein
MKRNEIIRKLVSEGFSEKTLVNFTDKQLNDLTSRMLSEQGAGRGAVIMKKGSNPTDIKRVTDSGMNVELREKEEGGLNPVDTLKSDEISKIWNHIKDGEEPSKKEMKLDIFKYMKKHDCTLDSLKEKCLNESQLEVNKWVRNLAETKYHSFTSKNEIMELISMKLNESEVHKFGPNVKTGHNGLPEFMTYDSIAASSQPNKRNTVPSKSPLNPSNKRVGPNPNFNGITTKADVGEGKEAPTIAPPKTKPGTTPKKTPFRPGPRVKPGPKAVMGEEGDLNEFVIDKPLNPLGKPYKVEKGRTFNEPEEPKTKPKKKEEEKKKKDHPVPQEAAEGKEAPTIAPPKTKPGTTPKKTPFRPGPRVKPGTKA